MSQSILQILEASAVRAPWGWALLATAILTYWKILPRLKEITNKREIDLLEKRGEDMRALEERLERMENSIAVKDAEVILLRHKLNNMTQCLDALVMLLKAAPEKVDKHIKMIEDMRAEQRAEEALEKGAAIGAAVGAAQTKAKSR